MKVLLVLFLSVLATSVASAEVSEADLALLPDGYKDREILSVENKVLRVDGVVVDQKVFILRRKKAAVVPVATAIAVAPVLTVEAPEIPLPQKRARTHVTTCKLCPSPDNIVFTHLGACDEECADARIEHNREFHRPRRRQVQQEYCETAPRRSSGFRLSFGGGRRVFRPQRRVVYSAPPARRYSGGRVYLPPTRPSGPVVRPPVFVGGRNGSNGSTVVVGSGRNGGSGSSFGTGQSGRFGSTRSSSGYPTRSGNPFGAR